jgi:hypothetical protein
MINFLVSFWSLLVLAVRLNSNNNFNDNNNHPEGLLERIGCIESDHILPLSGYDSFSNVTGQTYLCMPIEGRMLNMVRVGITISVRERLRSCLTLT